MSNVQYRSCSEKEDKWIGAGTPLYRVREILRNTSIKKGTRVLETREYAVTKQVQKLK